MARSDFRGGRLLLLEGDMGGIVGGPPCRQSPKELWQVERNRRHSVLGSVGEAGHTKKRKMIMFLKTLYIRLTSVTEKERLPVEAGAEAEGGVMHADGQRGGRGAWT